MSLLSPHRSIRSRDPREIFLAELLDALWEGYRARMEYVLAYEEVLRAHGARFFNDHVAFRCLAAQRPTPPASPTFPAPSRRWATSPRPATSSRTST